VLGSWEFSGESGQAGPGRAGPVRVFSGNPLIRLAGLYGLFCLLGIVLAWMCVIEQVGGGGGGGAGQYDFSSFPGFFGESGTIEMVGGVLYLNFHFLQFAVNSLGGWMCAVGILFLLSNVFCSGFSRFLNFKLLTLTNCSRMFLGAQHLEEGWDSCLGS
jgi:hypothetical protein